MSATGPICHITLASSNRGGTRQVELLVQELARRGWQQRIVTGKHNRLKTSCSDLDGVEIRVVASNPVAAGLAARGSLVCHAHEGRAVYACLLARLLFRVPYLVTRRMSYTLPGSPGRDLAYRNAARIAAISTAGAKSIENLYPGIRVRIVSDALARFEVDDAEVARIRERWPGKKLLGNVAALDHASKGQGSLIEVARRAVETHPDWQFVVCGDGPDEKRFKEASADLGNIDFVGWVDNVGDWLSSFDVFVFPSIIEGLGSSLLDAMQFGLPIVATRVGGIPDIITDGENGRLVGPEDAPGLYSAIEGLLADREELAAIRARNAQKALAYDATHMADAYETLYREIATPM